jgi:L-lysine 2,3-aminomutase
MFAPVLDRFCRSAWDISAATEKERRIARRFLLTDPDMCANIARFCARCSAVSPPNNDARQTAEITVQ